MHIYRAGSGEKGGGEDVGGLTAQGDAGTFVAHHRKFCLMWSTAAGRLLTRYQPATTCTS
jgi:hypothetical protein